MKTIEISFKKEITYRKTVRVTECAIPGIQSWIESIDRKEVDANTIATEMGRLAPDIGIAPNVFQILYIISEMMAYAGENISEAGDETDLKVKIKNSNKIQE